tara:strand:+ start:60 stop:1088 length:1029 start_codon:yes stop_codon:yes gene_type:complete
LSPKSFTVLLILTIASVFAALMMVAIDYKGGPTKSVGEFVLPNLYGKVNNVEKLVIKHAKGKITLISNEGIWTVEEKSNYSARTAKIKRTILGLAQLKFSEPKTQLKENYSKLELLDPTNKLSKSKRIYLFDKNGKTIGDIIVGKRRPSLTGTPGGALYVRRPGESQTWLAEGDVDISKNTANWLERKIINLSFKRLKKVFIQHEDGETLEIYKNTLKDSQFLIKNIPSNKKIASETEPSTFGKALQNLMLENVKKEASFHTLSRKNVLIANFYTFDGLSIHLQLSKQDGKFWIKIEASGKNKEAHVITERTKGWVYQIAEYSASVLIRRMKDLVMDAKSES